MGSSTSKLPSNAPDAFRSHPGYYVGSYYPYQSSVIPFYPGGHGHWGWRPFYQTTSYREVNNNKEVHSAKEVHHHHHHHHRGKEREAVIKKTVVQGSGRVDPSPQKKKQVVVKGKGGKAGKGGRFLAMTETRATSDSDVEEDQDKDESESADEAIRPRNRESRNRVCERNFESLRVSLMDKGGPGGRNHMNRRDQTPPPAYKSLK